MPTRGRRIADGANKPANDPSLRKRLWIDEEVGLALFFVARRGGFCVDYDPCFGRP
jgi:hypothetical protein